MNYIKIKIADEDYKDKFYRVILVNPKLDLYQFNVYLQILFKSAFTHSSLFIGDGIEFVNKSWIEDNMETGVKLYDYTKVTIEQALGMCENLSFVYDTGENYIFKLEILERFDFPLNNNLILLEASGDGIWEDNHSGLYNYLNGKLSNKDIYAWNLNIHNKNNYDFFASIDIEKINEKLELDKKRITKLLSRNFVDC